MAQNQQQPITRQRPQNNIFVADNAFNINDTFALNINTVFPVKEIRFSTAYDIDCKADDLFYLTCNLPIPDMGVIATCNVLRYTDRTNNIHHYCDSLDNCQVTYILREPTIISGNYTIKLNNMDPTNAFNATGKIIIRVELLG